MMKPREKLVRELLGSVYASCQPFPLTSHPCLLDTYFVTGLCHIRVGKQLLLVEA